MNRHERRKAAAALRRAKTPGEAVKIMADWSRQVEIKHRPANKTWNEQRWQG